MYLPGRIPTLLRRILSRRGPPLTRHALTRTLLALGALFALSGLHSLPAHAETPRRDALALLDQRLARAPRVRILTLAGIVEAKGVRADSSGLTYRELTASTSHDSVPRSSTLPWDAVLGVDAQVNRAARVAAGTGALFGFVGLIIGIATDISGIAEGNWAFPGAGIGVVSGVLVGTAIGSTIRSWVRVYPSTSATDAMPRRMANSIDTTGSAQIRLIAIAPLANFSEREAAVGAAQRIRESIFRELTRRSDSHTVAVQSLAETDRRIQEASLNASAVSRLPAVEICKLLGTDAVMLGAITRYRQKGAAGKVTSFVLLRFADKGREVEADLAIYEGAGGKLVWRQNVRKAGGLVGSSDAFDRAVGTMVADEYPYIRNVRPH